MSYKFSRNFNKSILSDADRTKVIAQVVAATNTQAELESFVTAMAILGNPGGLDDQKFRDARTQVIRGVMEAMVSKGVILDDEFMTSITKREHPQYSSQTESIKKMETVFSTEFKESYAAHTKDYLIKECDRCMGMSDKFLKGLSEIENMSVTKIITNDQMPSGSLQEHIAEMAEVLDDIEYSTKTEVKQGLQDIQDFKESLKSLLGQEIYTDKSKRTQLIDKLVARMKTDDDLEECIYALGIIGSLVGELEGSKKSELQDALHQVVHGVLVGELEGSKKSELQDALHQVVHGVLVGALNKGITVDDDFVNAMTGQVDSSHKRYIPVEHMKEVFAHPLMEDYKRQYAQAEAQSYLDTKYNQYMLAGARIEKAILDIKEKYPEQVTPKLDSILEELKKMSDKHQAIEKGIDSSTPKGLSQALKAIDGFTKDVNELQQKLVSKETKAEVVQLHKNAILKYGQSTLLESANQASGLSSKLDSTTAISNSSSLKPKVEFKIDLEEVLNLGKKDGPDKGAKGRN